MGKSQETFSKKEKEKLKLKKRRDKAEKMAERKANDTGAKSLDDMLAYLDENGNLSSTPPDPKKIKVINHEDIQLGAAARIDEPVEVERTGTITNFNESKGYGFIRDAKNNDSIFVHVNNINQQVREGDKVTFEVERGPKGMNAVRVKKI